MTESKKSDKGSVTVVLRGSQYGGQHGDERTVDAETAQNMVDAGTATYKG